MKRYSKQEILSSVAIVDLARSFNIALEEISSGNFTYRCKCPSPEHKAGSERTGSLYIDSNNNNFYCFGCGASHNVIDFYILAKQCDFPTALLEMAEFVDPAKVTGETSVKKKSNFTESLRISNLFRSFLREYPERLGEAEDVMRITDKYLSEIDRYDTKRTKALARKVAQELNRRKS